RRLLAQELARTSPRRSPGEAGPALGQHRSSGDSLRARCHDPARPRRPRARRGTRGRGGGCRMIIEAHGVEVFRHHALPTAAPPHAPPSLAAARLSAPDPRDDAIAATIDYRRVRDIVHAVNDSGRFQLLETFAVAIADSVQEQLLPDRVEVRVRKPGVAWAEWTAVTVERS